MQRAAWDGLAEPKKEQEQEKRARTMVCIALEDLRQLNGFPFELQGGEDVCIDSEDPILLLPTGGGKAILIWIDL